MSPLPTVCAGDGGRQPVYLYAFLQTSDRCIKVHVCDIGIGNGYREMNSNFRSSAAPKVSFFAQGVLVVPHKHLNTVQTHLELPCLLDLFPCK